MNKSNLKSILSDENKIAAKKLRVTAANRIEVWGKKRKFICL